MSDTGKSVEKLDFAQNAHRVFMEATGQWPKTKPPEKEPERRRPDPDREP